MRLRGRILAVAAMVLALACGARGLLAEEFDDGQVLDTYKSLKGKKVAFVPISMGFDLTQAWAAGLQRDADQYGYQLIIRDANWNVDAGAQALTQLIAEKPDVLIFHPLDMQAYSRLVKKALAAGIIVIQVNLKSLNNGDAFVGADWYEIAVKQAEAMVKLCGAGSGKSGKVAILQGVPTTPTSQIGTQGIEDTLKQHPEIKVVSNQAADWDATKAHAITSTVLKQNPDLCGIIGYWDGMDIGTAAAIREAGKTGQVYLVTSGGGQRAAACDNVANDNFTVYVSYDAKGQARDLMDTVRMLIQNKPNPPGSRPFGIYTPLKMITKETLRPDTCWTVDDLKKYGP
jgi:ribose transport system substrate-binding protein